MTSAAGGHVRLGTTELLLADWAVAQSVYGIFVHGVYEHNYESLNAAAVTLTGSTGKQSLRPEILLWDMDDWSHGETDGIVNSTIFDPQDPFTYDNGLVNPRIQGQITSPPLRTDGSIATGLTPTNESKGFLQNAGGQIWFTGGDKAADDATNGLRAYSSTDAATWTSRTYATGAGELSGAHANHYRVSATCADAKKLYAALIDDTDSRRMIHRFNPSSNSTQFSAVDATSLEFVGMAVLRQYLYGWTGSRLFQFDTTDTSGTAPSTLVYDTGAFDNSDPFPTGFSGGACATDNSVVMFFSDGAGNTILHEFKDNTGVPLLVMPNGFNAKCIGFANGVVYIAGIQGTQAALYALPMADRIERFLGYIRYGSSLTPVSISSGPGAQVLIAMTTGEVFIFDASVDSLSSLDTRAMTLYAVSTFKNQRLAAFNDNANTAFRYSSWAMDSAGGAANGTATLTSSDWDYDLPMEQHKVFLGIHARTSTLTSTATLQVLYGLNGAAPTTDAGTKTSGTDNFFTITGSTTATGGTDTTGTVAFGSIRIKVIATGTSGSACPTVYAVVPRAQNWNYVETWKLIIDLKNELQGHRLAGRAAESWQIRDQLLTYMENRTVVTFVDTFRYPGTGTKRRKVYTVFIEDVTDAITNPGEGLLRLSLRSVVP